MSVTLGSLGAGESLVGTPSSTTLANKSIVAGTGVGVTSNANSVTITNSSPASAVTLSSAGGTETLVNDGTGEALAVKGLTAGSGISLSSNANSVTITNSSPATSVTLSSAGGTETLVNDGTGEALAVKGLTAGSGISLSSNANSVTITNTGTASSPPTCIARRNVDTSVAPVSTALVSCNVEDFDNANLHNNGVNPTRITVPATAVYFIQANLDWLTPAATAHFGVGIIRNGSIDLGNQTSYFSGASASYRGVSFSRLVLLNANDYIECYAYNGYGLAVSYRGASNQSPIFSCTQIT